MAEIMPHSLQRAALQYWIIMHLYGIFRHIGGWSTCKNALLSCRPGLQATLYTFERIDVCELYFFLKNANFRIK